MQPIKHLACATLGLCLAFGTPAEASDHFDGFAVLGDPATDITDMYVFPSPQDEARLVLVMNVYPNAGPERWFHDGLEYRFRLRQASIAGTGVAAAFNLDQTEIAFSCTFDHPDHATGGDRQSGKCVMASGEIDVEVGALAPESDFADTGVRIFAGLRLDPFFMDVPGQIRSMKEGRLNFIGENTAQNVNALSIVMEIDAARLLPDPKGMYAVVSEIRTRGANPVVLDTFGRPEVTNVILSDTSFDKINQTIDVRDLFNIQDPFGEAGPYAGPFSARFNANLKRLDELDGRLDWTIGDDGAHPLTALHQADFTVVDLSKPVGNGSWFEIERAIVGGREHRTGGGRWLDDDISDLQYSFLIAGGREVISDGVDGPTKPAMTRFPYLNQPLR